MPMRILIVDDEPLARARLRALLDDCRDPTSALEGGRGGFVLGEANHAVQAFERLQHQVWDVVLLDIHMPGMDGLTLAQRLRDVPTPPAVVFVTAHAEHALQAFDLAAVDYLTKPVRLGRLQQALERAARYNVPLAASERTAGLPGFLLIQDRGRCERVPLGDVVYLKAELKYVTVRTRERSCLYDGSLNELEQAHAGRWLRIHRNALVARHCVLALEKGHDPATDDSDGWVVRLEGVAECLSVSRRQLAAVREAMAAGAC